MNIKWIGAHANNFEVGRRGNTIDHIVLHWIVGKLSAADATFQDPKRVASATYGVGGTEIHQYVKEQDTAYANGNLDSNLNSISIEHEGGPSLPISEDTYKTSAELIADIAKRYNISLDRSHIKGHKEVSLKATACPGALDIDKLISLAKGSATSGTMVIDQKLYTELITKLDNQEKLLQNLNQQINDRNNDITTLNSKVSTLEGQLQDRDTRIASLEPLSLQVPELTKKLEHLENERKDWQKGNQWYEEKIKELEKKLVNYEQGEPKAFIYWLGQQLKVWNRE